MSSLLTGRSIIKPEMEAQAVRELVRANQQVHSSFDSFKVSACLPVGYSNWSCYANFKIIVLFKPIEIHCFQTNLVKVY